MLIITIVVSFFLFLSRAWVGEDAFIFFKYVDNLLNGHGLVFNVGERVEGFTAPLWVFVLSFFRLITGAELRSIALVLGLLLSLITIFIILRYDNKANFFFPIGVFLLISNSAFRDYATSGFETSLSFLLAGVLALLIKYEKISQRPLIAGLISALLVLNRPETFLILLYLLLRLIFISYKTGDIKILIKFLSFPIILLGGYQLFRLGYYGFFFPNTYYAKKGGDLYITQGINYLADFLRSYPLTLIIILLLILYSLYQFIASRRSIYKVQLGWIHLFIPAGFMVLYVLRSGGDYMHGRSLLIPFLFLCIAINNSLDNLINKHFDKSERGTYYLTTLFMAAIILVIGLVQQPYTVRRGEQVNYINDERRHFGVKFSWSEIGKYFGEEITNEFGWRDRGYYYRDIAEAIDMSISVVMPNIGYFGYAGGEKVNVMGGVLIDPYLARKKVEVRGKIGHENDQDWPYTLSRKPTFSYTPFKYWNDSAHAKYKKSRYGHAITDDSNDSYVPVFDISNGEFIKKFSDLTGTDIKFSIDNAQITLMKVLSTDNFNGYDFDVKEYFSFLKIHWYPYTSDVNRKIYDTKRSELFGDERVIGSYEKFQISEAEFSEEIWKRATEPLTTELFLNNLVRGISGK
jgi:arabinofuranosyltransferase